MKQHRAKSKGKRALERSMILLRKEGFIVGKTEHWNPFCKRRQDLFGFADAVFLSTSTDGEDGQICALQCVNTHLPEHIAKIRENEAARAWFACGGGIVIHNWKQRSKNKVKRWECEVIEFTG